MSRLTDTALFLGTGILLVSCGDSGRIAGNSANTGNAQATGVIRKPSGAPAPGIWVECRPDTLSPWEGQLPGWTTITDSSGHYLCSDLPTGRVGITAWDLGTGLSNWHEDTLRADTPARATASDTLGLPGSLRVALPPGTSGALYLTGIGRSYPVRGETELDLPDIPAGWHGELLLARSAATTPAVIDSGLSVAPGARDSAGYTRRSLKIRVSLGGGLTAPVVQFPLLVRLDSTWPGFAQTLPDGSDLRVSTTAGKALSTTVASWDRVARKGAVWAFLDSVKAPGDSLDLILDWGIPVPASAPSPVFAAARGWVAAWPLGDTGSAATDRLALFPGQASSTNSVDGPFGKASRFDGRLSRIVIPGTATGPLAPPDAGPYTWSCWVRLKDFGTSRFVLGRGENGSHLKFQRNFGDDTLSWMAKAFQTSPGGGFYKMERADTARWTHLALTMADSTVNLYVDGKPSTFAQGFHPVASGKKAVPFVIGAAIDTTGATSQHFNGDIAEAWAQSVARSPDWIRLAAANQRPDAPAARPAK